MTGWGQDGPFGNDVGHDINYIALAGALASFGPAGGPPVFPINLVADFGGGGALLVTGMLAALLERARSGPGPGDRRRDGRRQRAVAQRLRRARLHGHLGTARHELPRRRRALLQRVRDRRRRVDLDRRVRAEVLRQPDLAHGRGRPRTRVADGPRTLGRAQGEVRRGVPHQDARRMVRRLRRSRGVLRARAHDDRGALRIRTTSRARRSSRSKAPRNPRPRRASTARRWRCGGRRSPRAPTPTPRSATGASPPPRSTISSPTASWLGLDGRARCARRSVTRDGSGSGRPTRSARGLSQERCLSGTSRHTGCARDGGTGRVASSH